MFRAYAKLLFLSLLFAFTLGAASTVSAQETNPATPTNDPFTQTAADQNSQVSQNSEPDSTVAQNQPSSTAENGTQKATEVNLPSFSYSDTKETMFVRSLVLSIGFFPFTYFYTGFILDISRFAAHNFSTSYAPWPFKSQYSVAFTDSEMWIKLGIASVTSLIFGFLGTMIQ